MSNSTKEYGKKHIGTYFLTNEGYTAKVIAPSTKPGYITIKIEEWVIERQVAVIKTGEIKYPFKPSVFGVGYFGVGKYTSKHFSYNTWNNMIARCYDSKTQEKYPTYKEVTVCKEWHNFQTFAKWYEKQYKEEGWQLDKDLLSTKIKIYSPSTCILIPQALNSFLTNVKNDNTSGEIGVNFNKQTNLWRVQISTLEKGYTCLGYFKSKQVASLMYKLARKKEADRWKKEMTGILPQQAINNIK